MINFIAWLSKKKCPQCRWSRLLAGPFYDRRRVRCLQCNAVFRVKEPSARTS